MQRPLHQLPTFTPGARLSRLPVKNTQSLEDYYHDLFANTGPEHDRQRLLQLLDLDVDNGAAAQGRDSALGHLDRAFNRIDAWTYQGDYLPQADRTELKRRVAHNLLAAQPGLDLAAKTAPTSPDHALLARSRPSTPTGGGACGTILPPANAAGFPGTSRHPARTSNRATPCAGWGTASPCA